MPKEQSVLQRLLVRVFPHLAEDWQTAPGSRFRAGLKHISEYFRDNVRADEKIREVPDKLWTAVDGITSEKHAKAQADYAKAENDRMETELRRRTLEAKTRHECADADKAEAEAGIAKLKEIEARIELFKRLQEIGVVLDVSQIISVMPAVPIPGILINPTQVVAQEEKDAIGSSLVEVVFQPETTDALDFEIEAWSCAEGDRIPKGFAMCVVSAEMPASPAQGSKRQILSPASGTVLEILIPSGDAIYPGQVLARILPDSSPTS